MTDTGYSIVKRYSKNPILTGKDFPWEYRIKNCFNSGCIKHDGTYYMMCRLEDIGLKPMFWVAESTDGYKFKPRPEPVKMPLDDPEFAEYTNATFYDPRITYIEEDRKFYVVHAAHSGHGCRLSLLESDDLQDFRWKGFISETDNRNGVLFPQKFNGKYVRIDRPNTGGKFGDIWISESPDLMHWSGGKCILRNADVKWAYAKIGPGAVPFKTEHGWVNVMHGVRRMCESYYVYELGVMLHDLNDPSKIIARCSGSILQPDELYEQVGQTPSVVFSAGVVLEDDGEVKIYYGGADQVQCVCTTTVDRLIDSCYNRPAKPMK